MEKEKERIVGTFLYAASMRNYEVHHLIFTTERLITASLSWQKSSAIEGIGNLVFMLFFFPFQPPRVNTDPLMINSWIAIKRQNKGRPAVSYDEFASEGILKLGGLSMLLHKISSVPYKAVKGIGAIEDPMAGGDYRLRISAGILSSSNFLIPESSLQELKELVGKTPLAQKVLL